MGPLYVAAFVFGLSTHMVEGPGNWEGMGVTVAWAIGREGSMEKVRLGGLGKGQWRGGNCLLERAKRPKIVRGRRQERAGTQAE